MILVKRMYDKGTLGEFFQELNSALLNVFMLIGLTPSALLILKLKSRFLAFHICSMNFMEGDFVMSKSDTEFNDGKLPDVDVADDDPGFRTNHVPAPFPTGPIDEAISKALIRHDGGLY